ncbi:MAG: DUF1631 family protein [Burkholderiales bacterium]
MGTRQERLLESCIGTAKQRLSHALSEAIEALPSAVGTRAAYLAAQVEGLPITLAASQAIAWRTEIVEAFQRELSDLVNRPVNPGEVAADGASNNSSFRGGAELRLIDTKSIEEEIAIGRLVNAAKNGLDQEIHFALETRLGNLRNAKRLEGLANPVGPEAIYSAMTRACTIASSEPEVKDALCQALQPRLSGALAELYRELNTFLQEEGVLPELKLEVERTNGANRSATNKKKPSRFGIEEAIRSATHQTNRGMTISAAYDRIVANLNAAEAAANDGPVDLAALANAVLNGPPEAINLGAGMLADEESALYRQVIALPVTNTVADALTKAQSVVAKDADGRPRPMTAIELIAPLAKVDQLYKHPIDTLTSQLVAAVFNYIDEDPELPTHIKQQLTRLQLVAMKAALLDRTFFARPEHPLRRMLSAIVKLAVDPSLDTQAEGPFERLLNETVNYLLTHFAKDLLIFDLALDRFSEAVHKHANPSEKTVAALASTLVAKEFLALARDDASQQLAKRVREKTPEFIVKFLQHVWAPILAESDVNGLVNDDSYAARIDTAEQLIWSVAPKPNDELPRLVAMLPTLIGHLRRGMRAADLTIADEEKFLATLMTTHTTMLKAARLQQQARPQTAAAKAQTQPNGKAVPQAANNPPSQPAIAHGPLATVIPFPKFKRGEIVEFRAEGKAVRRKLAWVSPRNSLFIFCSDTAGQQSLSAAELAEAMRTGRISTVKEQGTIIDRAVAAATRMPMAA